MTELQVISRVLNQKSLNILTENNITADYFVSYADEYHFIKDHFDKYHTVPDKETFLAKYPDFDIIDVAESDRYLIDAFDEEHLYSILAPMLNKVSELIQTDSRSALEYIQSTIATVHTNSTDDGIELHKSARSRYEEYRELQKNRDALLVPTGFEELDEIIGGLHMGEEFVVIYSRTGQGKTWTLMAMLRHMCEVSNKRIGLIEPEMSANKIGYRYDTVNKHISNFALSRGNEVDGYEEYISSLENSDRFFKVSNPKNFNKKITVTKLRSYVQNNKLDVLAIDGISYLTDERAQRGDSKTTQLTNISEDLMQLSVDLGIPVIVVCQSNREGAKEDSLKLENIRDSDGISYNASIVLAVMQKKTIDEDTRDVIITLAVNKNRNGQTDRKVSYKANIDTWELTPVNTETSDIARTRRRSEDEEETF